MSRVQVKLVRPATVCELATSLGRAWTHCLCKKMLAMMFASDFADLAQCVRSGTWSRTSKGTLRVESARWSTAWSRNASHRGSATWPRARLARGHRGPRRPFEGYLSPDGPSWDREGWLMSLGGLAFIQSDIGLVGGTVHRALAVHLLH